MATYILLSVGFLLGVSLIVFTSYRLFKVGYVYAWIDTMEDTLPACLAYHTGVMICSGTFYKFTSTLNGLPNFLIQVSNFSAKGFIFLLLLYCVYGIFLFLLSLILKIFGWEKFPGSEVEIDNILVFSWLLGGAGGFVFSFINILLLKTEFFIQFIPNPLMGILESCLSCVLIISFVLFLSCWLTYAVGVFRKCPRIRY